VGCIITAATLRPTAAAAANEKSEIHIISDIPLSVSTVLDHLSKRADNAENAKSFPKNLPQSGIISPFW
jgi:hypothetical protein